MSTLNAVPFRSTIFYTAAGPVPAGSVLTVGANGTLSYNTTITALSFSTLTASSIIGTTMLGQNSTYPNRFVELGSDAANSMYLDFHSSDAALPDYSTRIQSLGGATTGTGALNMTASTIGLIASNGVGIGTTYPGATLDVNGTGLIRGVLGIPTPATGQLYNYTVTTTAGRWYKMISMPDSQSKVTFRIKGTIVGGTSPHSCSSIDILISTDNNSSAIYPQITQTDSYTAMSWTDFGLVYVMSSGYATLYIKAATSYVYVNLDVSTSSKNGGGAPIIYTSSSIYTLAFSGTMTTTIDTALTGTLLQFDIYTNANAKYNIMTATTGNVGIGTANPGATLDVVGSNSISTPSYVAFRNTGSGPQSTGGDLVNTQITLGLYGPFIRAVHPTNTYTDAFRLDLCTNQTSNNTTPVPRISILSGTMGGYVGIGTTNPAYPMTVSSGGLYVLEINRTGANNGYGSGTLNSLTSSSGSFRGEYAFAFGGATTIATSAQSQAYGYYAIDLANAGTFASNGGYINSFFFINTSVACFPKTNVGIGMTPTYQLQLSSDSAAKPSSNTWTISSDERLKENITLADIDRCTAIIKAVPLKHYRWKDNVYTIDQVKDRSKLGWIAQDVQAVFPKAVGTHPFHYNQVYEDVVDENGMSVKKLLSEDIIEDCLDLNADQLYAVMYGAIQKLIADNESKDEMLATLQSTVASQEQQIATQAQQLVTVMARLTAAGIA